MTGVDVGGAGVASAGGVAVGSTGGGGLVGMGVEVGGTSQGVGVSGGGGVPGEGCIRMGVGSGGWVGTGKSCSESKMAATSVNITPPMATTPVKIGRQRDWPGRRPFV